MTDNFVDRAAVVKEITDPEKAFVGSRLKKSAKNSADIRGYFQWSLLDNFEWAKGYSERFGMIFVDYSTQKRILKDSGLVQKCNSKQRKNL